MSEDSDMILRLAGQSGAKYNYQPMFVELVKLIDKMSPIAQNSGEISKALKKLDEIEAKVKDDDGWHAGDGEHKMKAYGFQQVADDLRKSLNEAKDAIEAAEHAYDEFNKWCLRQGIK